MTVSEDVGPFYENERSRSRSRSPRNEQRENRDYYQEDDDESEQTAEVNKYKELFLEQLDINYKLKNKLVKMEKRLLKLEGMKTIN